jgi:chemotaxis protein methyltransferase CheR
VTRIQLGEDDFNRVRDLLDRTAGLVFDESRRDSLSYSLGERLGASGCADVDGYLALLRSPRGSDEMQLLLNEVTIQETHFFRNPPQFRALRQHVLPALVKEAAKGNRKIRVWSAGCSTGEEPYSIAMLLREQLPLLDGWDVQVIATDLSTRALDAARAGRYGARAVSVADPTDVARWFIRDGNEHVVRPEVRELVTFRHHNLVVEPPPLDPGDSFDLILCRNVTIYFSRDTTRALMTRLHESIREGGYLFLGHSETLWQVNDQFRLVTLGDAFVYRRQAEDATPADRRTVLPDRRTGDDGLPDTGERRVTKIDRRSSVWEALTKPRTLSFTPRERLNPPDELQAESTATLVAEADAMETVRAALRSGAYAQAAEAAEVLSEAEPMRADAHYLRGMALANLGRDSDALVALRKAVYVDPKAGFAHFLLAGCLSRLGNADAAARSYRAAAESLGQSVDDNVAAELGGRSVGELVEMCWQLSGETRGTP